MSWRDEGVYTPCPQEELPESAQVAKPEPKRRSRWSRRLLILLLSVLSIFGILHILQVIFGLARLFWDEYSINTYVPDWAANRLHYIDDSVVPLDATRDVTPIPCHSHNDYWRKHPLFDALQWGCTSVEADVWLHDEKLYVGHNSGAVKSVKTLSSLYVQPLADLLDKMNALRNQSETGLQGVFYTDPSRTLVLLIDLKTDGHETLKYIMQELQPLRERGYLTYYDGSSIRERPITVVGTGNTPFSLIKENNTYRDLFYDAPLDDLTTRHGRQTRSSRYIRASQPKQLSENESDSNNSGLSTSGLQPPNVPPSPYDATNSYYASTDFHSAVGTVWHGRLSTTQRNTLRHQIDTAHQIGLRARYWNTPEWPADLRNQVWRDLMVEGADILNGDNLRAMAAESWEARVHAWW